MECATWCDEQLLWTYGFMQQWGFVTTRSCFTWLREASILFMWINSIFKLTIVLVLLSGRSATSWRDTSPTVCSRQRIGSCAAKLRGWKIRSDRGCHKVHLKEQRFNSEAAEHKLHKLRLYLWIYTGHFSLNWCIFYLDDVCSVKLPYINYTFSNSH